MNPLNSCMSEKSFCFTTQMLVWDCFFFFKFYFIINDVVIVSSEQ